MAAPAPYQRARRRHVRVHLDPTPCRFRLLFVNGRPVDVREGVATAVNISRGGLCISSPLRLPTETPILLAVRFLLAGQRIEMAARVVWRDRFEGAYIYGLSFWGSGEAARRKLNRTLDALRVDRFA